MSDAHRSIIRVGTAGWSIPKAYREAFVDGVSHLQKYAKRLTCVEINSSFYRAHRPDTYERWAASVPDDFRFAVKLPREITHVQRLVDTEAAITRFVSEVSALGEKLGPLLVQLPPSLRFEQAVVVRFLTALRDQFHGGLVCEPRHQSWFTETAEALLQGFEVARAGADPALVPAAAYPGGAPGLAYWRLHGSPRMYYSDYPDAFLDRLAGRLSAASAAERWCIFDNTALGEAIGDALTTRARLDQGNNGLKV